RLNNLLLNIGLHHETCRRLIISPREHKFFSQTEHPD
ncbi:MAG: hypothetical protein ACI9HG_001991, partial [Flavobacteriales bacterium]